MDAYARVVYEHTWATISATPPKTIEEGREYFESEGLQFTFQPALNLDTPEEVLEYMYAHIAIEHIYTFVRVCDLTTLLDERYGMPAIDGVTIPYITMELFRMLTSCPAEYPNLTSAEITVFIDIAITAAAMGELPQYGCVTEEVAECIRSIWLVADDNEWFGYSPVSLADTLAGIRRVLALAHNARLSPFAQVWSEHYDLDGCMTTWIPAEMMEDVAWLSGYGTHVVPVPSVSLIA